MFGSHHTKQFLDLISCIQRNSADQPRRDTLHDPAVINVFASGGGGKQIGDAARSLKGNDSSMFVQLREYILPGLVVSVDEERD